MAKQAQAQTQAQTPAAGEPLVSDEQPMRVVRFRGGGYLFGVPARDLTAEEWLALTDDQRSAVGWSGLYDFEFDESQREDGV